MRRFQLVNQVVQTSYNINRSGTVVLWMCASSSCNKRAWPSMSSGKTLLSFRAVLSESIIAEGHGQLIGVGDWGGLVSKERLRDGEWGGVKSSWENRIAGTGRLMDLRI